MKKVLTKYEFKVIKRDLWTIKELQERFALEKYPTLLQTRDFGMFEELKKQIQPYRSEILWILRNFDFESQQDFVRIPIENPNWENYLISQGWEFIEGGN